MRCYCCCGSIFFGFIVTTTVEVFRTIESEAGTVALVTGPAAVDDRSDDQMARRMTSLRRMCSIVVFAFDYFRDSCEKIAYTGTARLDYRSTQQSIFPLRSGADGGPLLLCRSCVWWIHFPTQKKTQTHSLLRGMIIALYSEALSRHASSHREMVLGSCRSRTSGV